MFLGFFFFLSPFHQLSYNVYAAFLWSTTQVKGRGDPAEPSSLIGWIGNSVEQQLQSAELTGPRREAWEAQDWSLALQRTMYNIS